MHHTHKQEDNSMPSKTTSLALAIGCGVVFLVFLFANVGCLFWPALLGTALFGGNFYLKWQRDEQLIAQGNTSRSLVEPAERYGPPPRTSPGSMGLFVPHRHPDDRDP
jgi:hypothetical protein